MILSGALIVQLFLKKVLTENRNSINVIDSWAQVAQSVEQGTENPRVSSSILFLGTIQITYTGVRPHRLARSRTQAFHACDRGSNPLGDAI